MSTTGRIGVDSSSVIWIQITPASDSRLKISLACSLSLISYDRITVENEVTRTGADYGIQRTLVLIGFFMVALWNRETIYIFILLMAALCNRGAIIFLPCSFFLLLSSSSFLSSPNLSGRRSDVCHTSTHGVALVRI